MAAVGKAEENGYAERLIRTIKEEEVYLSEYRDFSDAHAQIGCFVEDVYMTKRIHSSLGYLTPVEYEIAWWQSYVKSVMASPEEMLKKCPILLDHYNDTLHQTTS